MASLLVAAPPGQPSHVLSLAHQCLVTAGYRSCVDRRTLPPVNSAAIECTSHNKAIARNKSHENAPQSHAGHRLHRRPVRLRQREGGQQHRQARAAAVARCRRL